MERDNFAASSSALHCLCEGPSSTKKPRLVEYDTSEGWSSSVEQSDNNDSTLDSFDAVARNLVEIGFPSEQVAHAIYICGRSTPIELILDFLQASCLEKQVMKGDNTDSMADKANILMDLGCTPGQVSHAVEICGKSTLVEEIFDFIQAASFEKEVGSMDNEEHVEFVLFQELKRMGFSSSAIKDGMQTCGSPLFSQLSDSNTLWFVKLYSFVLHEFCREF